jgi:soluble lytic murein transglycosylase-like protein
MKLPFDECQPAGRPLRRRRASMRVLHVVGITLAAVLVCAAMVATAAEPCRGPLPDPNAPRTDSIEKFQLVQQQCDVLAEPAQVQRAAQLGLYERGASATIRMSGAAEPPAAEAPRAEAPARAASAVPLDRNGRRVLAVAPALLSAARTHGLDPLLLHAIAHVESRHNATAVSAAGARGVMQVMPATARRFGVGDAERSLMHADTNVHASAAYLRTLRQRYGDNLRLLLAAYNAGEGAVDKYNGVPPYPETQAYVRDVIAVYRRLGSEFSVSPAGEIVTRAPAERRPS